MRKYIVSFGKWMRKLPTRLKSSILQRASLIAAQSKTHSAEKKFEEVQQKLQKEVPSIKTTVKEMQQMGYMMMATVPNVELSIMTSFPHFLLITEMSLPGEEYSL